MSATEGAHAKVGGMKILLTGASGLLGVLLGVLGASGDEEDADGESGGYA